ncbi:hypothetical protein KC332_g10604 [Hortaea werneckii]|uniref:CFEM domain-containing protein n=1 Tax=Hortaea werneckii EXF-2000 TaxID=1157616 RepID=A0A1Z5SRU0_HORWE|nr:hypothetical protein KC358_g10523 [Hortaea werneckii]OTA23544.1 hypothetical protein BTJ68_12655 [Hortaea werneckii EXF-2000]KAI6820612.1 hypothetical protein KC350_g9766 [Hortaea werneckii]KAI6918883.1 hypothetical protein KC348_g10784 [Hortaea werneckii]KAI6929746.1 hypothetical protein KC341_g10675 [Hortaea werneckii]
MDMPIMQPIQTRAIAGPSRTTIASSSSRFLSTTRPLFRRDPPKLAHQDSFTTHGIPDLLSPEGFKIAWIDYQQLMVDKLDDLTAGEPFENSQPKDLVLRFARDPLAASLFNHASMAHNNNFFFSGLSTSPLKLEQVPNVQESLIDTFGSIETLKATMLDTASAMFGPGFVWLVWARDLNNPTSGQAGRRGAWRILSTYLAGTPYPEAGYRQQGLDTNTSNASEYKGYMNQQPANAVGSFGPFSTSGQAQSKLPPGGTNIMPVLCVNTWEHVWLRDYGMHGKRAFLSDWWKCIDWSVVEGNTPAEAKGQNTWLQQPAITFRIRGPDMRSAFAVLAFTGTVLAQVDISNLPSCAFSCVTDLGGCNQLDITCICSDTELISGLACCVSKQCDAEDQDKTIQFAQNLCGGEGVDNLPTSATCASTASATASSTGTRTGTAAGAAGTTMTDASMSMMATGSGSMTMTATSTSESATGTAADASASGSDASSMGSSSASASAAEQTDNAGARSAEGGLGLGMLVAGLVAAL